MTPPWAYLSPNDRETFRTAVAFLDKRLGEQGTINWALKLHQGRLIERMAVRFLLDTPAARNLNEPWRSAWRLIEESWLNPPAEGPDGTAIYGVGERLAAGDRSGAAIAAVVELVSPRLKVEAIDPWRWNHIKKPSKPNAVEHLLSASLTSGDLIDPQVLGLAELDDVAFLLALANELEAAVNHGLDIARRLGWDGQRGLWRLGDLKRAYYVTGTPRSPEDGDPDAYHRGISPAVKLLHAVVARLSAIDPGVAHAIVGRWQLFDTPVHSRLWAAMSRDARVTSAATVAECLGGLEQDRFWDLHRFPEIAELRAVRFADMDGQVQDVIVAQIRKGPPRDLWPRRADAAEVKDARLYWTARELRRIEVGGGVLPASAKQWLDDRLEQYANLRTMAIDAGFPGGVIVSGFEPTPDPTLETVAGVERLVMLEAALRTGRRGWNDDPAESANDWIHRAGNAERVLADLEAADSGGSDFPNVWRRFGWALRRAQTDGDAAADAAALDIATRVLRLIGQLSDQTLERAVDSISAWLDAWERQAVSSSLLLPIWLRLWPIAVAATNHSPDDADDQDDNDALSVVVAPKPVDDDADRYSSAALNTPAGKLTGVFVSAWSAQTGNPTPFAEGTPVKLMRDTLITADGRSGLLVRYRLIEYLPFFLRADADWAQQHLIAPLLEDNQDALAFWRAVGRRTHFNEVLEIIGAAMADRANDRRLDRDTRGRLVFSLVVESLHAFGENRAPAVPNLRVQQMLRTLDDEVRAKAANAIQQFVRDLSAKPKPGPDAGDPDSPDAASLFTSSAEPFLREVWPQERSLTTPGVSGALADLPATSGAAFARAVEAIARFLVPFDCWSLHNYGLRGEENGNGRLAAIDDVDKARALLKLLDLTIGAAEGAVIPRGLTDALDQIAKVEPALTSSAIYRRLAAAARR
jgi:hypothetical protein